MSRAIFFRKFLIIHGALKASYTTLGDKKGREYVRTRNSPITLPNIPLELKRYSVISLNESSITSVFSSRKGDGICRVTEYAGLEGTHKDN